MRSLRRTGPRRPLIPWLRGSLPNVQAQGALVIDLQDGEELYARNADVPRPIASISKLAAALAVVDRGLALDAFTTVGRVDLDVARGGARSRLVEGMNLSNRDLLHAALLGSDNRAVSALGRATGLDATALAAEMTRKARELGLTQTRFEEPTGLSPGNQSTPREAIVLLRAVMDHPVLGPITRTVEHDVHPVGRGAIKYVNTYRPAARSNTAVLGGKTGFNNAARYCLVLAAQVGGRVLGMAFLGTEGELTRFGDVGRVSDWVVAYRARGKQAPPAGTAIASALSGPTSAPPSHRAPADRSPVTPPPLSVFPAATDPAAPRTSTEPPPPPRVGPDLGGALRP
jgi:D-alanyl-D-alanine endopeptidase (penicillin-binding protein 7)